jgi:hypothetical protein
MLKSSDSREKMLQLGQW